MKITIDRSIKRPIYKQIADQIEKGITSGELSPNQSLPSERELAKKLQVNRSTIVTVYDELESIGLVIRKRGSGTHVSTDIWGLSHKRIPNWGRYVEDGSFLPNLPLVQKLRNETQKSKMVNLASGELAPDLLPSEQFTSILKEHPFEEQLGYDHPQGNERLRESICQHVKAYKQMNSDLDSVLITSGAQQAIHLIIQCLLKPGDTVAIENPSYAYSLPVFQSAGLRTFLLPVDEHGVNPEDIVSLQKKRRIRMLFLNPDYQNPTGAKMTVERRKRILEISSEYGIPIIEDDPYNLTSFDDQIGPTLKSMDDSGNVVYISSLSKVVASGLRIDWVIGPQKVIERLSDAKQQIDFGHSVFPQWVANQFLNSPQFNVHILNLREQLKMRRDVLMTSLKSGLGNRIYCAHPKGGIHLWCKMNQKIDEDQLLKKALTNGVAYVPGSIMGTAEGYVRFTYGRESISSIKKGVEDFIRVLNHERS